MADDDFKNIYRNPKSPYWYMSYYDEKGRRRGASTGKVDAAEAAKKQRDTQRQMDAMRRMGVDTGPLTFERWAKQWVADRRVAKVRSAGQDEQRLNDHVPPWLKSMLLKDVRPHHSQEFLDFLRTERTFSPRMFHHVASLLKMVFADAYRDELIPANPFEYRRGKGKRGLPKKRDKDSTRKFRAKYTLEEAELLISHPDIEEEWRALYAVLLLGGFRIGEALELRFSDLETKLQPLGRIIVSRNWDYTSKPKQVVRTKTEDARQVPIHPTLAKVLAAWRLGGWERFVGRPPKPNDLICPDETGEHRYGASQVYKRLQKHSAAIGVTVRWTHATRHSFLSLLKDCGADPYIADLFTHAPPETAPAGYTHLSWDRLCTEMAKLRISLREGQLFRLAASNDCYTAATLETASENPQDLQQLTAEKMSGKRDLNSRLPTGSDGSEKNSPGKSKVVVLGQPPEKVGGNIQCSSVAVAFDGRVQTSLETGLPDDFDIAALLGVRR